MLILLDADTFLEYVLKRSHFFDRVKAVAELISPNSSIKLFLSELGVEKILYAVKLTTTPAELKKFHSGIKKIFTILKPTSSTAKSLRECSAFDPESAIEVCLAIENNIGAIVTHKPNDFRTDRFSIIMLNDLHLYQNLEKTYLQVNEPVIYGVNFEQINYLNNIFQQSPGHERETLPKPNKFNPQSSKKTANPQKYSSLKGKLTASSKSIQSTNLDIIDRFSSAISWTAETSRLVDRSLIAKTVNPFKDIQEPSLVMSKLSKSICAQTTALSPLQYTESLKLKQSLFSEMVAPFKAMRESVIAQSKFIKSSHAQISAPSVAPLKAMRESVIAQSKFIESSHAQISPLFPVPHIVEGLRLKQSLIGDTVDRFRAMQEPIDTIAKLRESIYPQTTALSSALSPIPYIESWRLKQSLIGEIVDPLKAMRESVIAQSKFLESTRVQIFAPSVGSRISDSLRLDRRLMSDPVDRFKAMQEPIDTMAKLRESIYPQTTALSSALSPAPYTESLRLKQSLIGEIVDPLKAMRESVVAQCQSIESICAQTATLSSASRIAKDLESMKVNWGSNR
jgi:hypothetical protein